MFNNGGSASLDVPEPPSSLTPPEAPSGNMDKVEKYQFFRQKLQYKRKKAEMYSLWCDCLYRLSLANHVSKHLNFLKQKKVSFFVLYTVLITSISVPE